MTEFVTRGDSTRASLCANIAFEDQSFVTDSFVLLTLVHYEC